MSVECQSDQSVNSNFRSLRNELSHCPLWSIKLDTRGTTDTAITISLSGLQCRPRGRGDGLMDGAGGGAPLENTRTVKVKDFTPQHGTSDVWKHFHLREACLEVKTPGGKKAPLSSSAARLVRAELSRGSRRGREADSG